MKVKILGVNYRVKTNVENDDRLEGADGCIDQSEHVILIAKFETGIGMLKNLEEYRRKVLRHEITHAFLYESGIWNNSHDSTSWGRDEEITDWIAIQSPKLFKAFQKCGCL